MTIQTTEDKKIFTIAGQCTVDDKKFLLTSSNISVQLDYQDEWTDEHGLVSGADEWIRRYVGRNVRIFGARRIGDQLYSFKIKTYSINRSPSYLAQFGIPSHFIPRTRARMSDRYLANDCVIHLDEHRMEILTERSQTIIERYDPVVDLEDSKRYVSTSRLVMVAQKETNAPYYVNRLLQSLHKVIGPRLKALDGDLDRHWYDLLLERSAVSGGDAGLGDIYHFSRYKTTQTLRQMWAELMDAAASKGGMFDESDGAMERLMDLTKRVSAELKALKVT